MQLTVSASGEPSELATIFEHAHLAMRALSMQGSTLPKSSVVTHRNFMQAVWSKITPKAKKALLFIANHHEGCTKEEIVAGVDELKDTRDLGGALSSVSRRCKALLFAPDVVYVKVPTANGGEQYVTDEQTAELIKSCASLA